LTCSCTCARANPTPCKHAVAALEVLRFPLTAAPVSGEKRRRRRATGRPGRGRGRVVKAAPIPAGFVVVGDVERTLTRDERIDAARAEELALRRHRARRGKAAVELIQADGGPPRFEVGGESGPPAVVTLRGPKGRLACCTCADFDRNELGTCTHIERVRIWYLRKKKITPPDLLSVWWSPREWLEHVPDRLRDVRVELPEPAPGRTGPPPGVARYFDEQGWLKSVPADVRGSAWVRRAVAAARRIAKREGWRSDIDPKVKHVAAEEQRREAIAGRCEGEDSPNDHWDEVLRDLGFKLHPYQIEGARFIAREGRAFLADDMGLGKTIQAISAALVMRRVAGVRRTLVVCPASLKDQWRREIEKACGERAVVVDGPAPARQRAYEQWQEGFLILNYELVLRDLDAIRGCRAELLLLDEGQRIKNWDTKTARAVKQLDSPYAFILTGTPLENRLLELHSLVELLYPRALGPRWRLIPYHAVTEREGRVIAYEGLDVLRGRLRGFFLRRERHAVLDQLPDRTDNTFWTGMTPAQREPYRKHASALAALIGSGNPLNALEIRRVLKALTSMRMLCNAYEQYAWNDRPASLPGLTPGSLHSPKLEEFARVLEDLIDESDSKIVVFSQWFRMLRLAQLSVRDVLEQRDVRAEIFHGALSARARVEMLDAFRLDPEVRVLFSTDAGGLGLNLQESASIVVNLEVPWNPAVLEQRIGRVHRIGQRRSVQVLHFITRDAIEERVRQVVEAKRALFNGLLVDDLDRVVFDDTHRGSFVSRIRAMIGDEDPPSAAAHPRL